MTDLFGIKNMSDEVQESVAKSLGVLGEKLDDILAGLIASGCNQNDVSINQWPNLTPPRFDVVVKGSVRYIIHCPHLKG